VKICNQPNQLSWVAVYWSLTQIFLQGDILLLLVLLVLVCKIRILYLSLRRRSLRLGVLKCTGCGRCACHTTATRTSFVRNRSGRRDALGPGAAGRPGQVARHVQCTVLRAPCNKAVDGVVRCSERHQFPRRTLRVGRRVRRTHAAASMADANHPHLRRQMCDQSRSCLTHVGSQI
jgi:hypothetical protein